MVAAAVIGECERSDVDDGWVEVMERVRPFRAVVARRRSISSSS